MIAWLFAAPFFATLFKIVGAIVEVVAPVFRILLGAIASGLVWLWQNVWWPGLRGAFDGLPQVLVIAQLAAVGYLFHLNADHQLAQRERELRQCRTDLTKARKPVARSQESPPLWDLFGWFKLP